MPHALMDTLMLKHDVSNRQTWPFWSKWHSPHEHWSLSVRRQSPQVEQSLAPHTWTPRRKGTLNCHLTHKSRWQSGPVPWLEGVGNKPFCPPGKTLMYRHRAEGILGYPAQPTSSVEKESWDGGGDSSIRVRSLRQLKTPWWQVPLDEWGIPWFLKGSGLCRAG